MRASAAVIAALLLGTPAFAMDRALSEAEQRYFGQTLLPFVSPVRSAAAAGMNAPECELNRNLGKRWDKAPDDPKELVSSWGRLSTSGVAPTWNLSWTCREKGAPIRSSVVLPFSLAAQPPPGPRPTETVEARGPLARIVRSKTPIAEIVTLYVQAPGEPPASPDVPSRHVARPRSLTLSLVLHGEGGDSAALRALDVEAMVSALAAAQAVPLPPLGEVPSPLPRNDKPRETIMYDVWSALLVADVLDSDHPHTRRSREPVTTAMIRGASFEDILFAGKADPAAWAEELLSPLKGAIAPELAARVSAALASPPKLEKRFTIPMQVRFFSHPDELVTDPKGDFWAQYRKQHPRASGLIGLSGVALSDDGNEAVVYASQTRGGLDGEGVIYVMRRTRNGWGIAYRESLWVS